MPRPKAFSVYVESLRDFIPLKMLYFLNKAFSDISEMLHEAAFPRQNETVVKKKTTML